MIYYFILLLILILFMFLLRTIFPILIYILPFLIILYIIKTVYNKHKLTKEEKNYESSNDDIIDVDYTVVEEHNTDES